MPSTEKRALSWWLTGPRIGLSSLARVKNALQVLYIGAERMGDVEEVIGRRLE